MTRLMAAIVAAPLLVGAPAWAQDAAELESLKQKFSYMVGLQIATRMMDQGLNERLEVDAFAQAFRDIFAGQAPRLTDDQMKEVMTALQQAEAAKAHQAGEAAKVTGMEFLEANKAKEGIEVTESGVQYRVDAMGDGAKPKASDTVKVHYEGRLLDGTVFDSSYARGEPAQFGVGQVIAGWQEVLQLMPVGSKWEVWIPSDLAYGANGAGGAIGPNETLNFTIELLEIAGG